MKKYIAPNTRVKISVNAIEEAPAGHAGRCTISKNAGAEGTYIGDVPIGKVIFAIIEFDDGKQDFIRKQYIEPL